MTPCGVCGHPGRQSETAIQAAFHKKFTAIRKVFCNSSLESATVPESQHFIIDMECAALTTIHLLIHRQFVALRNGVGNSSLERGCKT